MDLLGIIERHQGCGDKVGCFGPDGDYFTLFGRELRFLGTPIIVSLIIGIITFLVFYRLKKTGKLSIHPVFSFVFAFGISLLILYISITYFDVGKVFY